MAGACRWARSRGGKNVRRNSVSRSRRSSGGSSSRLPRHPRHRHSRGCMLRPPASPRRAAVATRPTSEWAFLASSGSPIGSATVASWRTSGPTGQLAQPAATPMCISALRPHLQPLGRRPTRLVRPRPPNRATLSSCRPERNCRTESSCVTIGKPSRAPPHRSLCRMSRGPEQRSMSCSRHGRL